MKPYTIPFKHGVKPEKKGQIINAESLEKARKEAEKIAEKVNDPSVETRIKQVHVSEVHESTFWELKKSDINGEQPVSEEEIYVTRHIVE